MTPTNQQQAIKQAAENIVRLFEDSWGTEEQVAAIITAELAAVPSERPPSLSEAPQGDPVSVRAHAPFAFCPVTHRPFFMNLEHPEMGEVPTFGGPFDSYTIPEVDSDGDLRSERYDHDAGHWVEGGHPEGIYLTTQQPCNHDLPAWLARSREPEVNCEHVPLSEAEAEAKARFVQSQDGARGVIDTVARTVTAEASAKMTAESALAIMAGANAYLAWKLLDNADCTCGACYLCAYRFIEAALRASPQPPSGWRPIAEAKFEDEVVLVYYEDGVICVEDLDHDSTAEYWKDTGARYFQLLPEPPSGKEK